MGDLPRVFALAAPLAEESGIQLVVLFEHCEVDIEDDRGTRYELAMHSAGGTGTEWRGLWMYKGRPPHGAASMQVGLSRRGEPLGRVELALA